MYAGRASFLSELSKWETAFDWLLERFKDAIMPDIYAITRCQYLCFTTHLTNCLSSDETVHDVYLHEMTQIVELFERLSKAAEASPKHSHTVLILERFRHSLTSA
jgi:hypothetical protein